MKEKVRIGFLGSGYVTGLHLDALRRIPAAQVAAFASDNREQAEALAGEFFAGVYTDYREMLDREALDAVYLCIPPGAHNGQELEIARRGIPMLIEKPVGLDLEYVRNVQKKLTEHNTFAAAGYHHRCMELTERAKTLLAGRKIVMCRCRYSAGMPGVAWWAKRNGGGGQLIEQSTHLYDLLRMFFGEAAQLQSMAIFGTMSGRREYDVEDASSVNLRFASGVMANVQSDCIYPNGSVVEMEFAADNFRLLISFSANEITVIDPAGSRTERFRGFSFESGFLRENQAFIHAVQTGDASNLPAPYAEAVKTLQLTLSAVKDFNTGAEWKKTFYHDFVDSPGDSAVLDCVK